MKYAIVENGSRQLLVKEGDHVLIDNTEIKKGSEYTWENILILRDGDEVKIGQPYVEGVRVKGKMVDSVKGPKVVNFKKKRRKGFKKKIGHRQNYSEILIEEIK